MAVGLKQASSGRRAWSAAALAAALAVTGGCGGSKSDTEKAADTVTKFFAATADGKGTDACALLTDSAVKELNNAAFLLQAPGSCSDAIKSISKQLSSDDRKALKNAKVLRVVIVDQQATVADNDIQLGGRSLFRNNDPKPLQLVKVGGQWRISSFG